MPGIRECYAQGRYRSRSFAGGVERSLVRMLLVVVRRGFNVWFWFRGIDVLMETLGGSFFWFCVRTDLDGKGRTAMKVMVLVAGVSSAMSPLIWDLGVLRRYWQLRNMRNGFVYVATTGSGDLLPKPNTESQMSLSTKNERDHGNWLSRAEQRTPSGMTEG